MFFHPAEIVWLSYNINIWWRKTLTNLAMTGDSSNSTLKTLTMSRNINRNLKHQSWSSFNILWSFQIVVFYIQIAHYLLKCLLQQYKPLVQWLKINSSPLRGFSQIYIGDTYIELVQSALFISHNIIYTCSTKVINGMYYKGSKQAGIYQFYLPQDSNGKFTKTFLHQTFILYGIFELHLCV